MLPDLETLASRLTAALSRGRHEQRPLRIVRRSLPPFMSTFPNEIVTFQSPEGRNRRVFIKYQVGQGHDSYGHRGDIPYEIEVYQHLLQTLPGFRPRCLGAHADPRTGDFALFLEYVYRSVRVSDIVWKRAIRQPEAMTDAARWIAKFHAAHEGRINDPSLTFLKRYDEDYYRGWARRTCEFARPLHGRFPWLIELSSSDEWFAPLLQERPTIIHGEFYAKTVLLRNHRIFMVDWESAAVAAGEIDLAALTEGKHWPANIVSSCENAYLLARWPEGAPSNFQRTFAAARIYLHFRWLGEQPDWTIRDKNLSRFDHLHTAAKRLGLI